MSESYDLIQNDRSDNILNSETEYISQDELKRYDVDALIDKAGGFGRMQWWIIIFAFITNQGFNNFSYNFVYLELVPSLLWKYNESNDFTKWDNFKDIWDLNLVSEYKVDYNNPLSFHNWITDHNLYCKNDFAIGSFGSCYFIGFGFMGLLLKFADNYGRKKLMFVGCLYHLLLILAILFSDDYRAYYVILFFGGISFAKETLIYVYTL